MAKNFDNKHLAIASLVLLIVAVVGFNFWPSHAGEQGQQQDQAAKKELNDQTIQTLVSSEELLLELTPRLRELSKSVMNLQLPGSSWPPLLQERALISGLRYLTRRNTSNMQNSIL